MRCMGKKLMECKDVSWNLGDTKVNKKWFIICIKVQINNRIVRIKELVISLQVKFINSAEQTTCTASSYNGILHFNKCYFNRYGHI